jgi:glucokinase
MRSVLAADLGGTKCRFGLVGADWTVHAAHERATQRDRARFLAELEGGLAQTLSAAAGRPAALGIGTAGVIRPDGRCIEYAPNLDLDGFELADHLERRFGLRCTLLNDGRASALGEYLTGAARGADPLLVLFFGTGIGIGLILGGRPYAGADNAAGEIGHLPYRPGGRRCACGRRGCYEAYCGGRPLGEWAAEELGPAPGGGAWSIDELRLAARQDRRAAAILDEAELAAGAMVAAACTLLNPAAVVLGGGVLVAWPELRARIEAFTRSWCSRPVTERLRFVASAGGADAILIGSAAATGALTG